MILQSKYLGKLEFAEEKIFTFDHGLIAFEHMKRFILIENKDPENPLWWLQSADDPELVFVVINPFSFRPDYDFEISPEDVEELGIEKPEDVAVFAITVVPKDIRKMTANLLAPVVFNARRKKGKQIVLQDKQYSTRHLILEELGKITGKKAKTIPVCQDPQISSGMTQGTDKGGCCHAGTD